MIFALLFSLHLTGVAIPLWVVWMMFGFKVVKSVFKFLMWCVE